MKFEVKKRELIPSGNYVGRCYSIVDLGTQDSKFGKNHQGYMTFELPTEMKVFNKEKGEQPCVVGMYFNFYLGNTTKFGQFLTAWRGKEMTDEEMKNFDVKKLLGAVGLVNVTIKEKNGAKFNDFTISQLPKGMTAPPQINPTIFFEFPESGLKSDFDENTYLNLPEWQQKIILESYEYNEMTNIDNADINQIPTYDTAPILNEDGDEIPF